MGVFPRTASDHASATDGYSCPDLGARIHEGRSGPKPPAHYLRHPRPTCSTKPRSPDTEVPLAVTDHGYGHAAAFRLGLQARGLNYVYVVGRSRTMSAHPSKPHL
ncbi:hypothetical protein ACWCPT_09240 [Streptomyces sp. NPDC002308]